MDEGLLEEHPSIEGLKTEDPRLQSLPLKADYHYWPRCSTDTLRSLDITHNIPRIIYPPMDTEDSPWGGQLMVSQFLQA